mmetsp:Transcript_22943/g.35324  ORF Transcript_22943/g.35324 Transcript_22943/m.35324 type:complete len:418 (-) Transcript_22943:29-1282(-)
MDATSTTNTAQNNSKNGADDNNLPPKRFIYCPADMANFQLSPARRDLLAFASAMGRSCIGSGALDTNNPLKNLTPAMASLYGSLKAMVDWIREMPPDRNAKARFGNPAFRKWHQRLMDRSSAIVSAIVDAHISATSMTVQEASEAGFMAAQNGVAKLHDHSALSEAERIKRDEIIVECTAYLQSSFGHPVRLDYGTGHESSFLIFIYALFKSACFYPNPQSLRAVAMSIFSQYLMVCRGLQNDYMLEPAGSHGVWGLDDYHCLPFYFGACQLMDNVEGFNPRSIHNNSTLEDYHEAYMYFGCIRYIKSLKKGAPFQETSPMLNDISMIESWSKVSSGLLRLYEGEVLGKLPVVQHFVFGKIFEANWSPSKAPPTAPKQNFINGPGGDECVAPWAIAPGSDASNNSQLPGPTRAPWAK